MSMVKRVSGTFGILVTTIQSAESLSRPRLFIAFNHTASNIIMSNILKKKNIWVRDQSSLHKSDKVRGNRPSLINESPKKTEAQKFEHKNGGRNKSNQI